MPAARAIEPVLAITALGIGETLLLAALRALPVHLLMVDVVVEQQAALRTDPRLAVINIRLAALLRTDEHRPAAAAIVLSLLFFLADRAFIHGNNPLVQPS